MPRVTCRCGEQLKVLVDGPERLDCPRCGAHIKLRQSPNPPAEATVPDDGFIRFHCPCGRRLKVRSGKGLDAGRCPDCGRVVPVPDSVSVPTPDPVSAPSPGASSRPARVTQDSRTDELDADDLARLARWSSKFKPLPATASDSPGRPAGSPSSYTPGMPPGAPSPPSIVKFEAGMRVCPRCGKPVHLNANTCRECGSHVPRN
jgi:predicted RNA-binding Zn-ribbon protein involved in translation (DUF1610 family)